MPRGASANTSRLEPFVAARVNPNAVVPRAGLCGFIEQHAVTLNLGCTWPKRVLDPTHIAQCKVVVYRDQKRAKLGKSRMVNVVRTRIGRYGALHRLNIDGPARKLHCTTAKRSPPF